MILVAEYGLHFVKEGDRWRCVARPELVMLPGERFQVDGQGFDSLAEAVAAMSVLRVGVGAD
jgi:hypothetical protein